MLETSLSRCSGRSWRRGVGHHWGLVLVDSVLILQQGNRNFQSSTHTESGSTVPKHGSSGSTGVMQPGSKKATR